MPAEKRAFSDLNVCKSVSIGDSEGHCDQLTTIDDGASQDLRIDAEPAFESKKDRRARCPDIGTGQQY